MICTPTIGTVVEQKKTKRTKTKLDGGGTFDCGTAGGVGELSAPLATSEVHRSDWMRGHR